MDIDQRLFPIVLPVSDRCAISPSGRLSERWLDGAAGSLLMPLDQVVFIHVLEPSAKQRSRVCWVDNFFHTKAIRRPNRVLQIHVLSFEAGVNFLPIVAGTLELRSMIH